MWRVSREAISFLGGGRATLLQLAHPVVAQGVAHHSRTQDDLAGRFQRTFAHVFALVFGERDAALASARRLHAIHTRVSGVHDETAGPFAAGTPYAANDRDALRWVWATLTESSAMLYEACVAPLDAAARRTYYDDARRFAGLFGLGPDDLPESWPAFVAYFSDMLASDELTVGARARELCGFLLTPPRPTLAPAWGWYAVMTAGLLPARLRDAYGFRWGRRDRALFTSTMATAQATYRHLPSRARHLPAYVEAARRVAGDEARRDWLGRLAEQAVTAALRRAT
ncbi:MAG: DUF2236 domain-containing protein [Myxococcales bacterium]|nr:DUF2236 domain-containing protein [Myxococcales bacterium]MCB9734215.1 DUF2236 domain-containing protein [Deltaproteobacteria bacterium]